VCPDSPPFFFFVLRRFVFLGGLAVVLLFRCTSALFQSAPIFLCVGFQQNIIFVSASLEFSFTSPHPGTGTRSPLPASLVPREPAPGNFLPACGRLFLASFFFYVMLCSLPQSFSLFSQYLRKSVSLDSPKVLSTFWTRSL